MLIRQNAVNYKLSYITSSIDSGYLEGHFVKRDIKWVPEGLKYLGQKNTGWTPRYQIIELSSFIGSN